MKTFAQTLVPSVLTSVQLTALRTFFCVMARAAPATAVRMAADMFCTPPRGSRPTAAKALLASARPFNFYAMGARMQGWSWGDGPAVYLVHGWGGRALSFARFVEPLRQDGYQVVAFDAPGHGASQGRISSPLHFSAALQVAVDLLGPAEAVIAHSAGATASAFAMRDGLTVKRVVFLGALAYPLRPLYQFLNGIGLPPVLIRSVEQYMERQFYISWPALIVPVFASRMTAPLLAIHDEDDPRVPWTDSAAIVEAWPNARLVTTKGLGHRGLLRNQRVLECAQEFISGR